MGFSIGTGITVGGGITFEYVPAVPVSVTADYLAVAGGGGAATYGGGSGGGGFSGGGGGGGGGGGV